MKLQDTNMYNVVRNGKAKCPHGCGKTIEVHGRHEVNGQVQCHGCGQWCAVTERTIDDKTAVLVWKVAR